MLEPTRVHKGDVIAEAKMITHSWTAGGMAFLLAMLVLPLLIIIARRCRLFDPTGPLKIHRQPVHLSYVDQSGRDSRGVFPGHGLADARFFPFSRRQVQDV